jgi:hypothetical protein
LNKLCHLDKSLCLVGIQRTHRILKLIKRHLCAVEGLRLVSLFSAVDYARNICDYFRYNWLQKDCSICRQRSRHIRRNCHIVDCNGACTICD